MFLRHLHVHDIGVGCFEEIPRIQQTGIKPAGLRHICLLHVRTLPQDSSTSKPETNPYLHVSLLLPTPQ